MTAQSLASHMLRKELTRRLRFARSGLFVLSYILSTLVNQGLLILNKQGLNVPMHGIACAKASLELVQGELQIGLSYFRLSI